VIDDRSNANGTREPGVILNVNDREQNRYVVSKMLRNAGFRVLEAATGAEALECARATHPDLIVLDIRLPDIDGMEVCRRLKTDTDTASSLILHTSATFASIDLKVRGLDLGGDGFLAQPFTSQELIATVKALLRLKRVEEFQRRRAEEFAEADRRKDDFLAMLGHELRNPLNAITMSQAIIDQFPSQNPTEERARGVARRQTAQLTRIVNDLLEVSRVTRGKITLDSQPLDLTASLRQVIAVVEQTIMRPRQQTLHASLPDYPVPVLGDRVRLEQVFTNLLDNASKYSPEGSRIDLEMEVDDSGDQPEAVVMVFDRGRGIAAEQLSHVFDLFYQGPTSEARIGSGLGIGLTLVKSLVVSHGGAVSARSEGPGRGSEFEVRLPTQPQAALAATHDTRRTPSKRRREARGAQTILIVEDNADAREMLETLCRAWGYQVEFAEDGLEGLKKATTLVPDIALVDIGLPGIDGYELARRVRASGNGAAGMKLVALTGYGLPEQRQKALSAGFDLHLVKPVDADALSAFLDGESGADESESEEPTSEPATTASKNQEPGARKNPMTPEEAALRAPRRSS
jgi:two-component system, sensor histidine kinase